MAVTAAVLGTAAAATASSVAASKAAKAQNKALQSAQDIQAQNQSRMVTLQEKQFEQAKPYRDMSLDAWEEFARRSREEPRTVLADPRYQQATRAAAVQAAQTGNLRSGEATNVFAQLAADTYDRSRQEFFQNLIRSATGTGEQAQAYERSGVALSGPIASMGENIAQNEMSQGAVKAGAIEAIGGNIANVAQTASWAPMLFGGGGPGAGAPASAGTVASPMAALGSPRESFLGGATMGPNGLIWGGGVG